VRSACALVGLTLLAVASQPTRGAGQETFDHRYELYASLLEAHVVAERVDYAALSADLDRLDTVVNGFARVTAPSFEGWSRDERLAFWINAYNVFTLKAVADHYPIEGRWSPWEPWVTLSPRNSIRQIEGVWDELRWRAAGRVVTLNEIESVVRGPAFDEPRVHFALHRAALSSPPLHPEPFIAARLDEQLGDASRQFLAGDQGVRLDGKAIRLTSILDWYWEDFGDTYAHLTDARRPLKDRAIFGVVVAYGTPEAAAVAKRGAGRLRFLGYDWSLDDVAR